MKPRLSVIVPAMRGYDTVAAALDSWEAQSCRDQLEILVLCPFAEDRPIPSGQVVIAIGSLDLHEARSLAIRQASADYVMLAEDHCLPDSFWAETILGRLEEGWDAVGPALRSGNPSKSLTRASFLIGYGQWMPPVTGGPTAVLPGNNALIRKAPLLELGGALERELLIPAFLLRRLRRDGQRFYLEDQAGMRHFDSPDWKKTMRIFYSIGLGFGALRTRRWPWAGRALFALAAPATACRHWGRALTHYFRAGSEAGMGPSSVMVASLLAAVWAFGESAGALMGVARVAPLVSYSEIKPVTREDVAAASYTESRNPKQAFRSGA